VIYLDHHATTPLAPSVQAAMDGVADLYGNPASGHALGRAARDRLELARSRIAARLGVAPDEIVFTSGATESNNLALRGLAEPALRAARGGPRPRIVVSAVEHSSVLATARDLEARGAELVVLPVDGEGRVDPAHLGAVLAEGRGRTIVVSVMLANNEIGTIQPAWAIADVCRRAGVPFHVDASQACGRVIPTSASPGSLGPLPGDLVSLSGHKMHGPKGVGVLVVRRGVDLEAVQTGGSHEGGRRAGTPDLAGAVGFEAACDFMAQCRAEGLLGDVYDARDRFAAVLAEALGDTLRIHGPWPTRATDRLPHNLHVTFVGVCPDALNDALGATIAWSSSSACLSGAPGRRSHVLEAIGADDDGAVARFGLGLGQPIEEIEAAARLLGQTARALAGSVCPIPPRGN